MSRPKIRSARLPALLVPMVAAATVLAGCGSHHQSGAPAATSPTTVAGASTPSGASTPTTAGGPTTTVNPVVVTHPCSLVTRAEAEADLHTALKTPVEAPQGPTCIYETTKGVVAATLVVERASFATIEPHVESVNKLAVAGHMTYCGTYGKSTLFVPLSDRLLVLITAPCAPARQLVAHALPRLAKVA